MTAGTKKRPLDTRVLVVTPENVAFDFRIAGPFQRCVALMVDLSVVAGLFLLIVMVIGSIGIQLDFLLGPLLIAAFIVYWGYGALCEILLNGQTPGKKSMGLRVVSTTGLKINPSQAFLRNLLRQADLFPPFFPGVVIMALNSRFQRCGDLAAGTIVVIEGARQQPDPPTVRVKRDVVAMVPASLRKSPELTQALTEYVGRRSELSPARREELASHLADYYRSSWDLPDTVNSDEILCAIYEVVVGQKESEDSPQDARRKKNKSKSLSRKALKS